MKKVHNIEDIIENKLYDKFHDSIDEFLFEYMTEGGVHEISENLICTIHDIDYATFMDNDDAYDTVWDDSTELSLRIIDRLFARYVKDRNGG